MSKVVERAVTMVEAGESKKFSSLNIAIGKYYLGRLDPVKAVSYLELDATRAIRTKLNQTTP